MRADYEEYHRLSQAKNTATSDEQIEQFDELMDDIAEQWCSGEHGQDWMFLDGAVGDWQRHPDTMRRMVHGAQMNLAEGVETLTRIQWRSLDQARALTASASTSDTSRATHNTTGSTADYEFDATQRSGSAAVDLIETAIGPSRADVGTPQSTESSVLSGPSCDIDCAP